MSNPSDFVIKNGVLMKYVGTDTDVIVPEGVTEIGENAFAKCSFVRSIRIPASVKKVNSHAFNTGGAVEEIVFTGDFCSFERFSFYGCQDLKALVLPERPSLGVYNPLLYCDHLERIVLPDSMAWDLENHKTLFKECSVLWDIQISDQLAEKLDKKTIRDVLLPPSVLCAYLRGKTICPALAKEIPDALLLKAKRDACVERLLDEDDAESLQKLLAMQKKLSLEEIESWLEKAGEKGKTGCKAMLLEFKGKHFSQDDNERHMKELAEKELGMKARSLAEWRKIFTVSLVGGKAYLGKYKGEEETVTVPAMIDKYPVVALGEKAFAQRETVRTICIEDGVEELCEKATWGCANLQDIHIPASVIRIGKQAILGKKRRIHAPEGSVAQAFAQENKIPFFAEAGIAPTAEEEKPEPAVRESEKPLTAAEWKKIWSYTKLPDGTLRLDSYKGSDEEVVLPPEITGSKVTVIGKQALSPSAPGAKGIIWKQRQRIRSITIPDTVTTIEDGAFAYCKELTEISVPGSVVTIGKEAFEQCAKLKSVVLPAHDCILGYGMFFFCQELEKVWLPAGLKELGKTSALKGMFAYCGKLSKLVLPDGLEQIGRNAFLGCASLSELSVPNSVTAIGNDAFSGCKNLTIHAPAGSYAEQYAKENNIPFVAE